MTNNRRDSVKGQLAKLLATENIVVQHSGSAQTASFDIKNRVLTLPLWKDITDDLYDLLVVHEVGHALDTPWDEWKDAIEDISARLGAKQGAIKTFLNVIEDVRIDKRQKRRYPGSRKNYAQGYKELLDRDFLGIKGRDLDSFSLIDRINIYYKGGQFLKLKFTAEERAFLEEALNTETFEEVVDLTERVYAFQKEAAQQNRDEQDEEGEGEGLPEDDDQDNAPISIPFDGEDEEEQEQESDTDAPATPIPGDTSEDTSDDFDDEDDFEDDQVGGEEEDFDDTDEDDPVAETETNWEKNQQDLVEQEDITYNYYTVPTPNLQTIVDDYKVVVPAQKEFYTKSQYFGDGWVEANQKALNAFKKEEAQTISFLVKEFEQKKAADEYARTSTAKTGVIDTNKLFRYKYNDDIFLRHSVTKEGKNHGFVMILDWSGSMVSNIQKTVRQLISLTMFCKRVQIPFEVYLFRNLNRHDTDFENKSFTHNVGNIHLTSFKLRNILSSRMNLTDWNQALLNLWCAAVTQPWTDTLQSTPLNEAIVAAEYLVRDFQIKNKVQIVSTIILTDGGADIPIYAYDEKLHRRSITNWKSKTFIRDEVSGKSHFFDNTDQITNILLTMLKDRTGANLIGFFIADNFPEALRQFFGSQTNPEFDKKTKKSWVNDGFFAVHNQSYDEYYVLNPKTFDVKAVELDVDSDMTKREIAKNFTAFASMKRVSRVLLKKFVEQIVK